MVREGRDATVVTLSLSVHHALDVAEELATADGIDLEVLDLRACATGPGGRLAFA